MNTDIYYRLIDQCRIGSDRPGPAHAGDRNVDACNGATGTVGNALPMLQQDRSGSVSAAVYSAFGELRSSNHAVTG
ncbi:MAG: hypothetical protein OEX75_10980, partial [Gammaproteobacteria bacterium]|nr:hypothetical protein [Gammaproteobacteria bacterium]